LLLSECAEAGDLRLEGKILSK